MHISEAAFELLRQEAHALLGRLARVKPFALHESMVPAANITPGAQQAIERYLGSGRRKLREQVQRFLGWLQRAAAAGRTPAEAQRRFTLLRLRFNAVLSQFDLFADALTQRSEHDTGVWLAGLDAVAADALALPGYYDAPAAICYLDRGAGAAIRRARTRLPGGGENPVAIIRVPRERMVGSGIASSLVHEVGHQAAALLDLVPSLRPVLQAQWRASPEGERSPWRYFERWISEILADFWSVARVGIASTLGLMGVVSLPRAFVFRVNLNDPHPMPWFRVKLSCTMGEALYPHPQWQRLGQLWEAYYPTSGLPSETTGLIQRLQRSAPEFVQLLLAHRPAALRGATLPQALRPERRQPDVLMRHFHTWRAAPEAMYRSGPSLAFAVLGQARMDGALGPQTESALLTKLLTHWALRRTLTPAQACVDQVSQRAFALAT
jgi:hypothetical protein